MDSLDAEHLTPVPRWEFEDMRLKRLCQRAWNKLPSEIRSKAVLYIDKVSDDGSWTQSENVGILTGHIERGFAKFNPGAKHIQLSRTECSDISEDTVMGVFIHEVAHAFETATVPDPTNPCYMDAIDYAGDALPSRWCFSKEIAALIIERSQVNHPVTPLSRDFKEENERWKDYAGALLIAMPVLLAGLTIAGNKTPLSIISAFAGLFGIIFIVLWYGRDGRSNMIREKYPYSLFVSSCCFGIQATMLAFAILVGS